MCLILPHTYFLSLYRHHLNLLKFTILIYSFENSETGNKLKWKTLGIFSYIHSKMFLVHFRCTHHYVRCYVKSKVENSIVSDLEEPKMLNDFTNICNSYMWWVVVVQALCSKSRPWIPDEKFRFYLVSKEERLTVFK